MKKLFSVADNFQKKLAQMDLAPLSSLLAHLRAAAHINQTHHWQTNGPEFYADHLLFQRLYEGEDGEPQDIIDQVAERSIGADSAERVDALEQINMMQEVVRKAYETAPGDTPEDMIKRSLLTEEMVLENIKSAINTLSSTDSLSSGTSNLLEGASDLHETFVYLLKQRSGM